jgi:hypothetical protein
MKLLRRSMSVRLTVALVSAAFLGFAVQAASAQETGVALQRGFRTGYSDGYMAGYRDTIDSMARNYTRHAEYTKADRAFNKDYGTAEDYRDGYQQGFESGYDTGYDRRSFESTLPAGLKRRGTTEPLPSESQTATRQRDNDTGSSDSDAEPVENDQTPRRSEATVSATAYRTDSGAIILIPRDTELILELQEDLNTQQSREGERFTAKIVSPSEIAGATVEGRISKIRQPGRLKRRSELLLSFDRIILNDTRWSNFSATLIEVIAVKGDNVSRIDTEGTALGKGSLKQDAVKVGGATGAGLVVGGVVGGPVGAAVGAGMGAAFGVGAVVIERGKHIRLNRNQQLRIKTAYETQIR